MNKVIYINAHFKPIGKEVTKKVPTGEKKKGLFGGEKDVVKKVTEFKQTGYSDSKIDGELLSNDIAKAVAGLNSDGYEVVTIMPTTSGAYSYNTRKDYSSTSNISYGWGWGYGYGYSYTEGVTIVAKKISSLASG